MDNLVEHLNGIRDFHAKGSKIHRLLGAIITDLKAGSARDKTLADCEKLQAEHPGSTIARAIDRVKLALG